MCSNVLGKVISKTYMTLLLLWKNLKSPGEVEVWGGLNTFETVLLRMGICQGKHHNLDSR